MPASYFQKKKKHLVLCSHPHFFPQKQTANPASFDQTKELDTDLVLVHSTATTYPPSPDLVASRPTRDSYELMTLKAQAPETPQFFFFIQSPI